MGQHDDEREKQEPSRFEKLVGLIGALLVTTNAIHPRDSG